MLNAIKIVIKWPDAREVTEEADQVVITIWNKLNMFYQIFSRD